MGDGLLYTAHAMYDQRLYMMLVIAKRANHTLHFSNYR